MMDRQHVTNIGPNNNLQPVSSQQPKVPRRPDIDVLLICLTWGILLFHVCLVYSVNSPFGGYYYVKYPEQLDISVMYIIQTFVYFMHAWNMPMFFYLSGTVFSWIWMPGAK